MNEINGVQIESIERISKNIGIPEDCLIPYGKYMAKIDRHLYKDIEHRESGKLILITAITPTPYGEGKTTTAIGLVDGLCKLGRNAIASLREPSLGPVFGFKGGATGGGYSQIIPSDDINLHFTGDMHAITAANNLMAALVDNHVYQGNELQIEKIVIRRCLDVNDRSLRGIFELTAASEMMAIICLATDFKDLENRISNIIVGYNKASEPIMVADLKIQGAIAALLKDALNPNLVQTLEHNPCLVHGGPFANIAHGCSSIMATKLALKLSEYVVTESGFGADLGAEKFLNIKCRAANIKPTMAVCVVTLRALKHTGNIENGYKNLAIHLENLKSIMGLNVLVVLNKFVNDTQEEITNLENKVKEMGYEFCINEAWFEGGTGAKDFARKVIEICQEETYINPIYEVSETIQEKIEAIAKKIYRAEGVEFTDEAVADIERIAKNNLDKIPVCIAKTQFSFSDNAENILNEGPYKIHISKVRVKAGAGFVVAYANNMLTMPGLPKNPSADKVRIDENENIIGIL